MWLPALRKLGYLSVSLSFVGPFGCRCREEVRGTKDSLVYTQGAKHPLSWSSDTISGTQLVFRLAATLKAVAHWVGLQPCLT